MLVPSIVARAAVRGGAARSEGAPDAQLGGCARFSDPATGNDIRPASCPHQICDYVMAAVRAGLRIDHVAEHAIAEGLAAASARAARYLGWPMLLARRFLDR